MPLNPELKLNSDLFNKDKLEQKATRDGYGDGLVELGEKNPNVVVLTADLSESTRSIKFQQKFPERFIECGIAEQNMMGIAAGLAVSGKIPFISTYSVFCPGKNWAELRVNICYNNANVKLTGAHAGISVGPDGATHQGLEDIAITRCIPNLKVLAPCDYFETKKATISAGETFGPVYLRFAREKTPVFTTKDTPFEIGKAQIFFQPSNDKNGDVAIIACGPLVYNALLAANDLEKEGKKIYVINNPSIKPLDEKTILNIAKKTNAIVTVEEHQIAGGMGSSIAEFLSKNYPIPIEFIGVNDRFGESGKPEELIEAFGMGVDSIKNAVIKVLKRK